MSMRWIIGLALYSMFVFEVNAQNLVPNPSFEETPCDSNWTPLSFPAEHWYNPNTATPDYYSEDFGPNGCGVNVIPDGQFARTGEFMIGIWAGQPSSSTREYVQTGLMTPLVTDSTYCISMHIRRYGAARYAVDRFGIMFSADSLYDLNSPSNLMGGMAYLSSDIGTPLEDTLQWIQLEWEYTAIGGEQFITLGNHWDNSFTDYLENDLGFIEAAYYFVDDVVVQKCTVTFLPEYRTEVRVFPNPFTDRIEIWDIIRFDRLRVYDALGNLIVSDRVIDSFLSIDTSGWNKGVYILELSNRNGRARSRQKMVKIY